jgi:hypothetical protein
MDFDFDQIENLEEYYKDEMNSLESISLDDINFEGGDSQYNKNKYKNIDESLQKLIFENEDSGNLEQISDMKIQNNKYTKKIKNLFEWTKLNESWDKKLLSKNFYIYDCIDKDDCNIENILYNSDFNIKGIKQKIKKYLKEIPFNEFMKIINNYKYQQNQNKEFIGAFDINKIKTRYGLIKELTEKKFILQNDNTTLYILSQIFDIDFIIFDDRTKEIIDLRDKNLNENIILILKESYNDIEYNEEQEILNRTIVKLIGIKIKDDMKTTFIRNMIPDELKNILDKHNFLLSHAKNAISIFKKKDKKLTVRGIIKEILNNIQTELSTEELNDLMIILKNLIDQELYKKSIKNKSSK